MSTNTIKTTDQAEVQADRRPERTRQWLQKALITLIADHLYEDITIQMIVDQANVARVTFYRHYRDKNELLLDYLSTVRDELAPFLRPVTPATMDGNTLPMMPMFQYIAQRRQLYKTILCGSIAAAARRHIFQSMVVYTHENLKGLLPHFGEEKLKMIACCINSTALGMLTWWLDNDAPCPIEELALLIFQHNAAGVVGFRTGG
jgi:AcrR family transcriptional regulator